MERKTGFAPVCFPDSRLLVLGSFPSVKSRAVSFYYGNKQNRFWRTVCSFFGEEIPETIEGKIDVLRQNRIALWDVVTSCLIQGSSDATIQSYEVAKIEEVLKIAKIEKILCNGATAYDIFKENYPELVGITVKMPSTSPANPRFDRAVWEKELSFLR